MKVLVTGVNGQLGFDVIVELKKRGYDTVGVDAQDMDITDFGLVSKVMNEEKPQAVIHCAAYTAVDKAEENIDICRKVNVEGTENIAKVCKELDCKMMYISTDYVFEGEGNRPWEPDDKVTEPLNVYGLTKYEGEQILQKYVEKFFIVRISWVFGINGNNFIKTMLRLGKEHGKVSVVSDQIGSPTYTADLAILLCDMMESEKYGIYHATNEGFCSWYDFACEIFKVANMDVEVIAVDSNAFPVKAKRPKNSRMSKAKLTKNGFDKMPIWQDATRRYIEEIGTLV